MSEAIYKIKKSTLDSIANAIRTRAKKTDLIKPSDMAEEILTFTDNGGVSIEALSKITATTDKVEEGYTFYDNTGNLSTGTKPASTSGTTIEPVNDVSIWQRCADLTTTYTTVAQILADTTTLKTLLYNSNAKEYMIRSTTIMTAVIADSNAISILDNGMPYINPDMSSATTPYGNVSMSFTNNYNYYGIFNSGEVTTSSSYYYTAGNGGWIIWVTNAEKGVVPYKFTIKDTYGQNVKAMIIGIKKDWSSVELTDVFTIPKNTLVTVYPNKFEELIGFGLHIINASNGANNWSQFSNCKMYAI